MISLSTLSIYQGIYQDLFGYQNNNHCCGILFHDWQMCAALKATSTRTTQPKTSAGSYDNDDTALSEQVDSDMQGVRSLTTASVSGCSSS